MRKDLLVIVFLGLLVLLGTAGLIILSAKGKQTDPALVGIVTGALGALSAILVQTKDDAPPAPPVVNVASKVAPLAALAALLLGLAPVGCASWWGRTPEHAGDLGRILVCVDEKLAQGIDPKAVALQCGLENADAILDLVRARKARAAAAASASGAK